MTTRTRKSKTFEPGHGYTKEEWDAVDFPELTDEELTNMRPARDVLQPEFFKAMEEHRRSRGRPSLEHPKKQLTLRLDEDVIAKFRAGGKGWQSRMNEALRKAAGI
ncbi:BrnA antitoxin family protein [Sinorhizobium meliloti]|uniref:BrnA antitoxin family protein n=1 Tax=Rhizobium meliloti TaxID=382 RepID=UPI0018DA8E18|nr:BrnA antitoxin family protein [Sinorhizobium meliloti]QPI26228.1 BrnA antitoxin family protein [Sinorhizobium meliloti]